MEFRNLVQELFAQANGKDGRFVLSDNDKSIKISDKIQFILDVFSLTINSKKAIDKIYSNLIENIESSELYMKKEILNSELINLIEGSIERMEYNLEYSCEYDFKNILKICNVHFEEDEELPEKIAQYMKVYKNLLGYEIFTFINVAAYLSDEEVLKIIKYSNYNKINLLFIEQTDNRNCFNEAEKYIIDKDLCEIY